MAIWINPKTDWTIDDRFNIEDYNRIKNNLNYLHRKSEDIYGEYAIEDMGADVISHAGFWDVDTFNKFESNLETINAHMINADIGLKQTFYPNGVFIGHAELNRMENAILTLKAVIDGWYEAMPVLSFRLGGQQLGSDRAQRIDVPVSITVDASQVATQRVGTPLDLNGLVVTATYRSGETADVTSYCGYDPAIGTILTETGTQEVDVTFEDEGVTLTDSFNVTVTLNIPSWADATDAQIAQLTQMHYEGDIDLYDYWHIGDRRVVHLDDVPATTDQGAVSGRDLVFTLADKGGKVIYDNDYPDLRTRECAFVVATSVSIPAKIMPSSTTVVFNYILEWLNTSIFDAIRSNYTSLFKRHKIDNYIYGGGVQSLYNKFAPIAEKEFTGTNVVGQTESQFRQFELYEDPSKFGDEVSGAINPSWTRTISSDTATKCARIDVQKDTSTTPPTYTYRHQAYNATSVEQLYFYGVI